MHPEVSPPTYAATGYLAQGGQKAATSLGPKVLDRPMTEIENVTAQMADTARRLGEVADRIQGRVDGFMQAGEAAGFPSHPAPPPQPGTLGALRYYQGEIETQTNRLQAIASNLAGII